MNENRTQNVPYTHGWHRYLLKSFFRKNRNKIPMTGNSSIDESRRDLFNILRNIELLWSQHKSSEIDMEYARFKHSCHHYFQIEELILSEAGYPVLDQHIIEHNGFMKKINVMQLYYQNKGIDAILESVWYLHEHLLNHIKIEDKKFLSYVGNLSRPED